MQTFAAGDRIKIKGKKHMHYGTVGTLAHSWGESNYLKKNWPDRGPDFYAEMYRRQGDRYDGWAIQDTMIICADPGFYDRERERQAACREVTDGEIVLIDDKQYRVKFVGDFSSIIHFYAVN